MRRRWHRLALACLLCTVPMMPTALPSALTSASSATPPAVAASVAPPFKLAVLGDSDSHGYRDTLWTPGGRGGAYAEHTLQWTEALARLRGPAIDLGPVGVWGTRKAWGRAMEWFGVSSRMPRKLDHQNNFAFAGAQCSDLMQGGFRQAPRLRTLMDADPEAWRGAVVVIRSGITSVGYADSLDQFAADPNGAAVQAKVQACIGHIRAAVALIHRSHPQTRFVLVGILNNAHFPPYLKFWQSAREMTNIDLGLDRFDASLKALAAADPRMAFFDDRAWFAARWGGRDAQGRPAYAVLHAAPGRDVSFTQCDHPSCAVLADGHAGAVWNVLWAQSLVDLLRLSFQLPVPAIAADEVRPLIDAAFTAAGPKR